jgi:hypothetical protein
MMDESPSPRVCVDCGSSRLASELRDSNDAAPERRDYGSWIVCRDCCYEAPDPEPVDTALR